MDQFVHVVSQASAWAYAIVFALAVIDAIIPIVPSETAVITAGVVASAGDLSLGWIVLAAAAGAFAGDNTAYLIGHRYGARVKERFFTGEKARRRLDWAERQLQERGGQLIVVARFIPGGRTAVTLSAGSLGYVWRRFALFDAAAALIWALYASFLGYFGGQVFESAPWKGLLLALAIGFAMGGVIEGVRWLVKRWKAGARARAAGRRARSGREGD